MLLFKQTHLNHLNIVAFIGLNTLFSPNANAQNPQSNQQDLKLWYNKPSEKWVEALPVGNGKIGAMIFGGVEDELLQINESTLWSGGPV